MSQQEYVWKDRKHTLFGLPWSFTKYRLTKEKLVIESGFFSQDEEEIRLYRIMDLTLRRSLRERLWGLGTIHCCSADKSSPEFDIKHIRHSKEIKDMLSDMIETERDEKRISGREYFIEENDAH